LNQEGSNDNETAIYHLNMGLYQLASALKYKNNDSEIHFKLSKLLEEKYIYECLHGSEKSKEEDNSLELINKSVKDGSKDEEIEAICRNRNVGPTASDAEKLKAVDEEYRFLIESNQSAKADQVQLLYQFKSQQINKVKK
jgi:hypothetical protein